MNPINSTKTNLLVYHQEAKCFIFTCYSNSQSIQKIVNDNWS